MKIYKIFDEELDLFIGTLLYYEKAEDYIIELSDSLDEWTAPLLLTSYVKKGIFTIPREISFLWVKERIIPSGRQNIGAILDNHKMKQYSELPFLELSGGRCSQDHLFIKRVNELPDYVVDRAQRNVRECVVLSENTLLCFFAGEITKKVNLEKLAQIKDVNKILRSPLLIQSCKVATGGYSITFNDSIDIPASVLYEYGELVPLDLKDFITFVQCNILDTSDVCDTLACSRQNVSYLVKQEQLTPIKKEVKGNLYTKGDVLRNKW